MDEEYIRLLNSNKLQELFDCRSGYMDQNDCTWYHENWMLLRYLGVVSNPFWHEKFYENAIQQYVNQLDKVLILGTADFSMPYLCQMKGIKKLKICDICRTPLNICQNVAKANNFSWEVEQKNVFEGIAAALCGGFLFPFAKTKTNKAVAVFSMIPIMLVMLFCNGKSGFLSCIILWGSAFLTSFFYIHKQSPKVDLSKLIGYSILAVFALAFLLFSMMLRIGHVDLDTFNVVTQKFMSYAFGEIQAFDCWFELGRNNIEYSAGVQTFMAIFHSLGIVKRKQGVYGFIPGVVTNVYTVFRGIIVDFGTIGGLVFVTICGCLAGYYFEKIKYSVRLPVVSFFFVISIEFFFMYGYIISPWIYASYMAMMVLFVGFTMLCKRKSIKIVCGNKVLIG